MSPKRNKVSLSITPISALADQPIQINVENLAKFQPVTLCSSLQEERTEYVCYAHYTADQNGNIDLEKQPAIGGNYFGIEPMGLIWAMTPAAGQRRGTRLVKKDVTKPFRVKIAVRDGHVNCCSISDAIKDDEGLLALEEIERWYMAPGVKRIRVHDGKVRGVLFLPQGDGPFPGLIDMFGSAGGIMEFRAALFASNGFAALSLAYFNYEDLPTSLRFDLEYFEEAVDWLSNHPNIKKSGIGTIAVSLGTDYAFYMSITKQQVKATVAINGTYLYSNVELYKNGIQQPSANSDLSVCTFEDGICVMKGHLENIENKDAIIPVEKASHCQFLLLHSEFDQCISLCHRDRLKQRFDDHGCTNYQLLSFPGAGHLLEPPYSPLNRVVFHKVASIDVDYGGKALEHAKAQEASWSQILKFFNAHLNSDQQNAKSKL